MEFGEDFSQKARELTKKYFKENNHNCAESVLRALLEASGKECSLDVVRMASAFGRGMGRAGCCCGALVGSQMAVGVIFGRENDKGYVPDICGDAAKLAHKRFIKANGSTCCRELRKGLPFGSDEQLESCCNRSIDASEIAANVIVEMLAKAGSQEYAQQEA